MKKIIASLLLTGAFFLNVQSCKAQTETKINRETETERDGKILLGLQSADQFNKPPYSDWFTIGYEEYHIDNKSVEELKNRNWDKINMTVFVGTWCEDSHREFPRLMKILNEIKFPVERLVIIATDRKKQTPDGEHDTYKIEKVPTIILSAEGKELGRIVESPLSGYLERDLLEITKARQ